MAIRMDQRAHFERRVVFGLMKKKDEETRGVL